MLDVIVSAFKTIWDWFLSVIAGVGSWALAQITNLIPGLDSSALSSSKGTIAFAVSAANAWAPIDLIITLAISYMAFVIVFLGIKIALKLIP